MKQPNIEILSTGEIKLVSSLVWLDEGRTIRAFAIDADAFPMSYVIVKGHGEETEVNAKFI